MGWGFRRCLHLRLSLFLQVAAPEATIAMYAALAIVLLFSGSRDNWISFVVGAIVGLAVVLAAKRLRRKEDR